jgi:type I restriction enzyme R subunit
MNALGIAEDDVEVGSLLPLFENLGYTIINGPTLAPDGERPERQSYADVVLRGRLDDALRRINPGVPQVALDEAVRRVLNLPSPSYLVNNHAFHQMLVEGVDVEWAGSAGPEYGKVWLVDYDDVEANDWLCVNQFTVIEAGNNRRPDVVVFVNGLPLSVIELKNPADEKVTVRHGFNQLQTYKREIPSLFAYNGVLVTSNEWEARLGSLTADWDRFMAWRTIDGVEIAPKGVLEQTTLIAGVFAKWRLLDLLRYFVAFEADGERVIKKIAQYHQYYAVNKAVERTIEASRAEGDRRAGVVWHTQGSGKSLSMLYFAGKIAQNAILENPTIIVLTDRNDLDEQLLGTFLRSQELVRQKPVQADSRSHLKELLSRNAGGVVFTTIQKFAPSEDEVAYPQLSDRRNIIFIADEAHRSQYDFIDGFARNMRDALPNATFIGFTGTPIEADDKSTPAVFGDYIDIYDIHRAVEDEATVPIYYEARLAQLTMQEDAAAALDDQFEQATEGEETEHKEKLKSRWSQLEEVVGSPARVEAIATDLVEHWERRASTLTGKAMIVGMSRRICVDLYNAIVKLRPDWHSDDDATGKIKVVMTGSAATEPEYADHIRSKARQSAIATRVRNPDDEIEIVIVRDMWLTGFDAPCLHTMYVDKPMRGHGLMQAIARVNRRFRDKPGGLIVDYIGIGEPLKRALQHYSSHDRDTTGVPVEQATALMQEHYEVALSILHGFDITSIDELPKGQWGPVALEAYEIVLSQEDGKDRFTATVNKLMKAFALASASDEARAIATHAGFLQLVKARLNALTVGGEKQQANVDAAIRQIISGAIAADGIVDIFAEAGLSRPDIGILSDEFLDELSKMPQKNLALETLKKLLNDEIKSRQKRNLVQSRSFRDLLEKTLNRYRNRSIEAAQVLQELIDMARDLREADKRGEDLGLGEDEVAFYDALETSDSAVMELGDETLKAIARDLVRCVQENATIDWTLKEGVRAKMRVAVKRLLRKYGYPPDKQEQATATVIKQAELMATGAAN